MSTKKIKQRIAVLAVSTLTAGVLSVVAAPVANAGVTVPTNLACTVGDAQITLTWTASTVTAGDDSITKYQYSTDAGPTYKDMPTAGTTATATTRTLTEVSTAATALVNGTAYSITIKAVGNTTGAGTATAAIICTPGVPEPGQMFISTAASTTGAAAQASGLSVGATSLGWISQTSTTATAKYSGLALNSGNAATGVVNAGAKIAFNATSTVTNLDSLGVVVTGGTISNFACLNAGTPSLSGASTTAVCAQAGTTRSTAYGVFNISAAVGSTATITVYKGTSITGTSSATNGSLIGTWTLTVATADASGEFSATQSSIFVQAPMAKGGTATGSDAFDYSLRANNGEVHVVRVALKDAYAVPLTSGTLNASVTNGATVNAVDTAAGADSYAATSSFDTISLLGADGVGYVVVNQPVANTAGSSTLTLTFNGAVIATKTLNWNGDIASLTVDATNSAKTFNNPTTFAANAGSPAAAVKNIIYVAKDAAGNTLTLTTHPTIGDQTGSMVGSSLSTVDAGAGALTDDSALQTQAVGFGVATMLIPNSALRGAGTYQARITNAVGTVIKSAVQNVTVSGGAHTFTTSWDKATYAPGDIATLTITAKDSSGNLVGTGVALGTGALIVTNTDGLSSVTASCDSANIAATTYTNGVKECKFAVKNTEGAYSWSAVVANASGKTAEVGTATIKASVATVSNADVLKSIVALIASINKQIQALQKLILKR